MWTRVLSVLLSRLSMRFTVKTVRRFWATHERSTTFLEVFHCDSRKSCGGMMFRLVMVHLMNGNGSMDYSWLNGFLLNDWLDRFMNVVVDMGAVNYWLRLMSMLGPASLRHIIELSRLGGQTLIHGTVIAVVMLFVLDRNDVVVMLLRENLAMVYRLDRGVMVMVMDLLVNDGCVRVVFRRGDVGMRDGRLVMLMDCSIVFACPGREVLDCSFGFLHVRVDGRGGWMTNKRRS
jgi:hypothetical protein